MLPWDRFHRFKLDIIDGQYHLMSKPEGESAQKLGVLDVGTQGYLDALMPIEGLTFEAVVASTALGGLGKGKKKTDIVDVSVNIIGPEILADDVGGILDTAQVNLQHPMTLSAEMRYINPQWWYATSERTDLSHLVGPPVGDSNSRRISNLISAALGSLDKPKPLQNQSDPDLSGPIPASEFLRTKLKPYVFIGFALPCIDLFPNHAQAPSGWGQIHPQPRGYGMSARTLRRYESACWCSV